MEIIIDKNMKINRLTERRQELVLNTVYLDVNCDGNIVYNNSREIVPDSILYNFFEFNNI